MTGMTQKEMEELEVQLSCPTGENGVSVGKTMNESNIEMTKNSIRALSINKNDRILEIGHGNCGHLAYLMKLSQNIHYVGLEVSKTMKEEAERMNTYPNAEFHLYDGIEIPFESNNFDHTMTVNTLYFWSQPDVMIKEMVRVLKPGATCILTYAQKAFMKKLPFVGKQFRLYDKGDVCHLITGSKLEMIECVDRTDYVKSKSGEMVVRPYTVTKLIKTS